MLSSSTFLMISSLAIILIWTEVATNTVNGQPLGMEDYYNLIEPKDNVNIWMKPKGKVNMKNLILSIKKIEAKQKQYWNKNKENENYDGKTEMDLVMTTSPEIVDRTVASASTDDSSIELQTPSSRISHTIQAEHYEQPLKIANLHEQIETDQKRFFHSALDGWIF